MAYGLEARSPLLDPELMQFAASLPAGSKSRLGSKKRILRRAYRGTVPDEVLDGKKRGFGVPLGAWFRNELRDYTREVLLDPAALRRGLVREEPVRALLDAARQGGRRPLHADLDVVDAGALASRVRRLTRMPPWLAAIVEEHTSAVSESNETRHPAHTHRPGRPPGRSTPDRRRGVAPWHTRPKRLPASFFGIAPQTDLSATDTATMRSGGIGTIRLGVSWSLIESSPGRYEWYSLDSAVAAAAESEIQILPYLYATPERFAPTPTPLPIEGEASSAWASFLQAAVARYGPGGSFWNEHAPGTARPLPAVPIRPGRSGTSRTSSTSRPRPPRSGTRSW